MAAITHLAVACFFKKKMKKRIGIIICIIAAYFLDILAIIFTLCKVDFYLYKLTHIDGSIWSHSLIMALIWSFIFGFGYFLFKRNIVNSIVILLIVFSHWLIDLITWPLGCIYKNAPGLFLIWNNKITVGFGLYNSVFLAMLIEFISLIISILILINIYKKRNLKESKQ